MRLLYVQLVPLVAPPACSSTRRQYHTQGRPGLLNFLVAGSVQRLALRQAVLCICIVFNWTGVMPGPGRGRDREPYSPELLPRIVLASALAYQLRQPWRRLRVVHLKPAAIPRQAARV